MSIDNLLDNLLDIWRQGVDLAGHLSPKRPNTVQQDVYGLRRNLVASLISVNRGATVPALRIPDQLTHMVAIRVSQPVISRIDELAAINSCSRTVLARALLEAGLDVASASTDNPAAD